MLISYRTTIYGKNRMACRQRFGLDWSWRAGWQNWHKWIVSSAGSADQYHVRQPASL